MVMLTGCRTVPLVNQVFEIKVAAPLIWWRGAYF